MGGFFLRRGNDNDGDFLRRTVTLHEHFHGESMIQVIGDSGETIQVNRTFVPNTPLRDFSPSPLQTEKLLMLRMILGSALALAMVTSFAAAADNKGECLQEGEAIGAFYVTKVAGADGDGVEEGQELCYRCRYGSRPMVMVFARNTGGKVPQLIKQLDSAVAANESAQLKGFVTLMGDDATALKQEGEKIAELTGAKQVPVTVAKESKSGPASYRIPEDSDVTVVVANDSKVVGTHTFTADLIDIDALEAQVKKMLN